MSDIQKELEYYQKIFSLKDHDLAISGYIAYVNFVRQQVEYIKEFKVKDNIEGKKAETVVYDRGMAMGESLPDMISRMNKLKGELNIEYDYEEGKPKTKRVSPQSIGE